MQCRFIKVLHQVLAVLPTADDGGRHLLARRPGDQGAREASLAGRVRRAVEGVPVKGREETGVVAAAAGPKVFRGGDDQDLYLLGGAAAGQESGKRVQAEGVRRPVQ